ncbi:hypothetical protein niasHS_015096 [Heterodera schachtii]|uniref:Transmembrane protein n=1 Tax=Heterodera schachtii TaxID=97005 RepID=A0ABD2I534_HETSC
MANFPPNSDEGFDRGNFSSLSGMVGMNQRQLDWLMKNISHEDMAELQQRTGQCARKCAVTYGGPIVVVTIGFLEFLRRKQNLPITAPRFLIGYPIMCLTSVALGSSIGFKRSGCGAEMRLFLDKLYAKYDSQMNAASAQMVPGVGGGTSPTKTYAQLREANRAGRPIELGQLKQQQTRQQQKKMDGSKATTEGTEGGGGVPSDEWGRFGLDGVFAPSPPASSSADGTAPSPPRPKSF